MTDHIVDHFGQKHCLAHACAAEQSSLASTLQRHQYIDSLDARLEDLGLCRTLQQRRWSSMDSAPFNILRRRSAVDGGAEYVEHPRHDFFANRYLERLTGIFNPHSSGEAFSRG